MRRTYFSDASPSQTLLTDRDQIQDDALGGRAYYLARAELEIPLGAGARELGLRPSIYAQVGSLWNITRPNPTVGFCGTGQTLSCIPQLTDPTTGNTYYGNILTQQFNSAGQALYTYTTTDPGTNLPATLSTTCAAGIPDANGACVGTIPNSLAISTTTPFIEQYLGNSAKPRLSVGVGVNWNSPFGPLRIDVAKALLSQRGDDKKLITFNVGTQF